LTCFAIEYACIFTMRDCNTSSWIFFVDFSARYRRSTVQVHVLKSVQSESGVDSAGLCRILDSICRRNGRLCLFICSNFYLIVPIVNVYCWLLMFASMLGNTPCIEIQFAHLLKSNKQICVSIKNSESTSAGPSICIYILLSIHLD
jgi:hypothetical protein